MTTPDFIIPRDILAKMLGNPRAVVAFERMQAKLGQVDEVLGLNVEATGRLNEAYFVTLSPNAELPNERVLSFGEGISGELTAGGLIIGLSANAARAQGGFRVTFVASGDTQVAVPLTGVLATRDNEETLTHKTLAAPKLSGLVNAVDDAAAAASGVPVGGAYRNGSVQMVRVA